MDEIEALRKRANEFVSLAEYTEDQAARAALIELAQEFREEAQRLEGAASN